MSVSRTIYGTTNKHAANKTKADVCDDGADTKTILLALCSHKQVGNVFDEIMTLDVYSEVPWYSWD